MWDTFAVSLGELNEQTANPAPRACHGLHHPDPLLSPFPSQDFLKYSKKASLDTSELEVLRITGTIQSSPAGSPSTGVWPWVGRAVGSCCALCTLGVGQGGADLGGAAEDWHASLPQQDLNFPSAFSCQQRAVEVMCIVPKRCNDMMNVGRLQGFDVMPLFFL